MDTQQTYLIGSGMIFFLTILPILTLVVMIIFGILQARRRPPIAEELARSYATKSEVTSLRAEFQSGLGRIETRLAEERAGRARIHEKIEAFGKDTANGIASIERSIGRLEGELKNHIKESD